MHYLRMILRLLFEPLVFVLIVTFGPLLVGEFDFLNIRSEGLSRNVGIDLPVYIYYLLCYVGFAAGYGIVHAVKSALHLQHSQLQRFGPTIPLGETHRRLDGLLWRCGKKAESGLWRTAFVIVLCLAVIGISVTFYTASNDYLIGLTTSLNQGVSDRDLIYGPEGISQSDSVPGIIRMFDFSTLAAFILLLALGLSLPQLMYKHKKAYLALVVFAGITVFIRCIIGGTRTPIIIVILLTIYVFVVRAVFSQKNVARIKKQAAGGLSIHIVTVVLLIASFWIFSVVNTVRGINESGTNPILDYADLGVANTALAIRTATTYSYGFSTILSPFTFVDRALGWQIQFPSSPDVAWISNPAGSLPTYSFLDFGFFGFIVYVLIGFVVALVRRYHIKNRSSVTFASAYLWSWVAFANIWTVPLFRGPNYWAGALGSVIGAIILDRLVRKKTTSERNKVQRPSQRLTAVSPEINISPDFLDGHYLTK